MIGLRQQAGHFSLSLPLLIVTTIISSLFLAEVIHGQPNYYFKASGDAPAVKSLPRIGRRSDGEIGGRRGDGGGETSGSMPLLRSLESPGGIVEMWQATGNSPGNNMGGPMDSYLGRSLIAPAGSNPLDKAMLWRRLFGDGSNSYEEALLDNMYRSKS